MDYTEEIIRQTAKNLDIDIEKYDIEQVKMGMAVELEHGTINADKKLNVTNNDPTQTLQITLAHLEEDPEYYTKLLKYVEQPEEEKVEESYKLKGFDNFFSSVEEDGEGGPVVGATTLDSVSGMGAPVLAGRGITGSGDVPNPVKKKKTKRVKTFDQFIK